MMIRSAVSFIILSVFAFLFGPLENIGDATRNGIFPTASAGFENAAERAKAMRIVMQKKLPPGACGSLILKQEDFQFHCGKNMRPLQRKYCESKFSEIVKEKKCEFRPVLGRMMTLPEKCDALKIDFSEMCGANEKPDVAADCAATISLIKADCN